MMKGYRERRENIRAKKNVYHGVALEQYGRKLIEDIGTRMIPRG
jgi:hypothetical protein